MIYVGSSNFAGWDIATACQEASKRGLVGLASGQSIYHLNNRIVELEVIYLPPTLRSGIYSLEPLGGWSLGGALEKLDSGQAHQRRGIEGNQRKSGQTGKI